jgi:hypothetical protein
VPPACVVVLTKRIHEGVLPPEQNLSPLALARVSENPPLHVLGFDHEDAVSADEDVIDLSRSIWRRQDDVVKRVIDLSVEQVVSDEAQFQFADVADDSRRIGDHNNTKNAIQAQIGRACRNIRKNSSTFNRSPKAALTAALPHTPRRSHTFGSSSPNLPVLPTPILGVRFTR